MWKLHPFLTVLPSRIIWPTTKTIVTMMMLSHFMGQWHRLLEGIQACGPVMQKMSNPSVSPTLSLYPAALVVEGHTGLWSCHTNNVKPLCLKLTLSLSPSSITWPQKRLSWCSVTLLQQHHCLCLHHEVCFITMATIFGQCCIHHNNRDWEIHNISTNCIN